MGKFSGRGCKVRAGDDVADNKEQPVSEGLERAARRRAAQHTSYGRNGDAAGVKKLFEGEESGEREGKKRRILMLMTNCPRAERHGDTKTRRYSVNDVGSKAK